MRLAPPVRARYRVLDGLALLDTPTSTTKSMVRLTRPPTAATDFWETVVGQQPPEDGGAVAPPGGARASANAAGEIKDGGPSSMFAD